MDGQTETGYTAQLAEGTGRERTAADLTTDQDQGAVNEAWEWYCPELHQQGAQYHRG